MKALAREDAARHMDGIYRYQRHIYDLTRKYYLLGRDRMIATEQIIFARRIVEMALTAVGAIHQRRMVLRMMADGAHKGFFT